ncbi:MAG: hypothetical protein JSW58_08575 [Candidatus Latescibacterota bacterium]|nr:MAG: hypothetical protein JSW58_08575 [Candidatus Latescibacterota bacterium]
MPTKRNTKRNTKVAKKLVTLKPEALGDSQTEMFVSKILGKKWKPEGFELYPGTYEVKARIQLEVEGILQKVGDHEYTPTVDIPLKATLALLLQRMGIGREAAMEVLAECMSEAIEAGEKGAEFLKEKTKDVEIAMARVTATAKKLPKKTRKGALKVIHGKVKVSALQGGSVQVD